MASTQTTADGEKDSRLLTSSTGPLLQSDGGGSTGAAQGGETLQFQELEEDSAGGAG